jgi:hypothetical protein
VFVHVTTSPNSYDIISSDPWRLLICPLNTIDYVLILYQNVINVQRRFIACTYAFHIAARRSILDKSVWTLLNYSGPVATSCLSYPRQPPPFFLILKWNHNNKHYAYIAMSLSFLITSSTHNATILLWSSGLWQRVVWYVVIKFLRSVQIPSSG